MGRYDFRPSKVHEKATDLIRRGRLSHAPAWYPAVGRIPPSQTLTRTQPIQHHEPSKRLKGRKASKLFKPQQITYEEDALRKQFYSDHPWELARPRTLVETDGKDYQSHNWSTMKQATRRIDGESVVQRQLWLQSHAPRMTKQAAYDQARKEFYAARLQQEVEARVAKEEALSTSAYFGKSRVQIGAELEDINYERWRQRALADYVTLEQKRASAITSYGPDAEAEDPVDDPDSAQQGVDAVLQETAQK